MEKQNWIKTEQMLKNLENDPDNEHEYRRWLGGFLFSTHWLFYDSSKQLFKDSTDGGNYNSFSKEEALEFLGDCWWHRDA